MKFDLHYLFSPKYAKWIIIGLIAVLSLMIIGEYASLLYSSDTNLSIPNTDTNPIMPVAMDSTNAILNASLFGLYVSNDLNDDNVKKSTLDLTLVGILLANHINESQVIIRSASGDEKTYSVTDSIPGGAVIKKIIAGGVLVELNGTLERLSLPDDELHFEPIAKPLKEED